MKISIIIPAYNEEDNINKIYSEIGNILKDSDYFYEIIFVNDGSTDNTERRILELIEQDDNIKLISFSKNFGHVTCLR